MRNARDFKNRGNKLTRWSSKRLSTCDLHFQEKRSVKSVASDKSKNDSEASKNLEEERKKYLELQRELDLQVKYIQS